MFAALGTRGAGLALRFTLRAGVFLVLILLAVGDCLDYAQGFQPRHKAVARLFLGIVVLSIILLVVLDAARLAAIAARRFFLCVIVLNVILFLILNAARTTTRAFFLSIIVLNVVLFLVLDAARTTARTFFLFIVILSGLLLIIFVTA